MPPTLDSVTLSGTTAGGIVGTGNLAGLTSSAVLGGWLVGTPSFGQGNTFNFINTTKAQATGPSLGVDVTNGVLTFTSIASPGRLNAVGDVLVMDYGATPLVTITLTNSDVGAVAATALGDSDTIVLTWTGSENITTTGTSFSSGIDGAGAGGYMTNNDSIAYTYVGQQTVSATIDVDDLDTPGAVTFTIDFIGGSGVGTTVTATTDGSSLNLTTSGPPNPVFVSVAASDGTYGIGDVVAITATWDKAVTGTGSALTLSNGATASYTSGNNSAALVFNYTVGAGNTNSADLKVTGYSGTIEDSGGNAADSPTNPSDLGAVIVDASSPAFVSVAATDGTYKIGQTIPITVTWDDNVNISGTVNIVLSNSATASYASGTGGTALVFNYAVAEGHTDSADLKVTSYSGTIEDGAGNAAASITNPSDLGAVIVDANAPAFVAVAATDGTYKIGQTVPITVTWGEIVNISGTVNIVLSNSATASYASGTGSVTLLFNYVVAEGDTDSADLRVTSYSGTIADAAGNAADSITNPSDLGAVIVDANAPAFVSVAATDGTYKIGQTIPITVTWGENVNISGTVNIVLSNSATASYASGTGGTALVFNYAVTEGDTDSADLKVTSYSGTIADGAGNAAKSITNPSDLGSVIVDANRPAFVSVAATDGTYKIGQTIPITVTWDDNVNISGTVNIVLSNSATASYASGTGGTALVFNYAVAEGHTDSADLKVTSYSGTIEDGAGNAAASITNPSDLGAVIVDANAPAFVSVAATDGTYKIGQTIPITVTWDENVNISGTPTLVLSNSATASYASGSGNAALVFNYAVVEGHTDSADLKVTSYSGTIADAAGNAADSITNPSDLGAVIVDANAPAFVSVAAADGTYIIGQTIPITVTWGENVNISGTVNIVLSNSATASYASGTGGTALVFNYAVTEGNTDSADLKVTSYSGTIADGAGNAADSITNPSDLGSVIVDANRPGFVSVAATDAIYYVGDVIVITVTWDDSVTISGTPELALDNNATAIYESGTGTTALVFNYTVGQNDTDDMDLSVVSYTGTITDVNGNAAGLVSGDLGSVGACGHSDPHIHPIFGDAFELPMTAACFRMLQGEELVVNALTRPTTAREQADMVAFAKTVKGSCPKTVVIDGVFFGKLFIASEGRTLVLDYDTRKGTMNEEEYFSITSETQKGVCTPYGNKYQTALGGVQITKVCFTHSQYGKLEVHASFSSNPWVKHGIAAKLSRAAVPDLTGLFIREYQCKSMRVNKLTSQRKKTGIVKKNRVKTTMQPI